MKKIFTLILLLPFMASFAQSDKTINIDSCYAWARQNYPLLKQYNVIEQTKSFTIQNAWRGYLPQLNVSGQATYQSEVVNFKDVFGSLASNPAFANIPFPVYSKDQYRLTAEAYQTIFDGLASKFKKENALADAEVKKQNLEVNLYSLRDRVDQVYFGVLLIDEELKQNDLQQKDIQNVVDKTQAFVDNGTAFRSSVDELKAQLLQVQQSRIELIHSRKSYLAVLSLLIGRPLDEAAALAAPPTPVLVSDIKRPELQLFQVQKKSIDIQSKQLETGFMPQINAYFDGSYGRPTLNSFSNDFGAYWITGIRFNWTLTALYTFKNTKRIYSLSQNDLDIQKDAFLFNTNISLTQQNEDIKKYGDLVEKDKQIVDLRTSVKNASNSQLQNGVLTAHDYLTQVDAEAGARLSLILHQVQLLQAEYNYQNTSGN
jgi:outer membrane protein TolC